jgi:hypothetical protein
MGCEDLFAAAAEHGVAAKADRQALEFATQFP